MANGIDNKALSTYFTSLVARLNANGDLHDDDVADMEDALQRVANILNTCLDTEFNLQVQDALLTINAVGDAYIDAAASFLQEE